MASPLLEKINLASVAVSDEEATWSHLLILRDLQLSDRGADGVLPAPPPTGRGGHRGQRRRLSWLHTRSRRPQTPHHQSLRVCEHWCALCLSNLPLPSPMGTHLPADDEAVEQLAEGCSEALRKVLLVDCQVTDRSLRKLVQQRTSLQVLALGRTEEPAHAITDDTFLQLQRCACESPSPLMPSADLFICASWSS